MLLRKADLKDTAAKDGAQSALTPAEQHDLRRLAGFMVPASTQYRVPAPTTT